MDAIQPKSLWFDIKLSESVVFTPPTGVGIYELNSEERHFQGLISPTERLETVCDLLKYIQREFQITSPICMYTRPNGNSSENSESVNTLPKHSTLLVGLPKTTKMISTPNSSLCVPLLNCSASAISTELNASSNTTVVSVVPNNIVMNVSTKKAASLANSDSDVDGTIYTHQDDDDDEILETATMRNPVSSAASMSFADWEFLDVQRRLKSFMNEANIEGRHKLKKWFLEFYETFERKRPAIASARKESRVRCSSVDTNESETSMASEAILNDPTTQLPRTVAEATPAFLSIAINESTDISDLEPLTDDADSSSGSDGEDSTSTDEENKVSGSDREETSFYDDNNTSTSLSNNSEPVSEIRQSGVPGSNFGVRRSLRRVTSRRSHSPNVPLKIATQAGKQQQTPVASKTKATTTKAMPLHSCSYSSCNFKTRGLVTLKTHLGKVHFETPFKCGKCGRKYRLHASFTNHLRTHEKKKYVCPSENCNYKSWYSSNLKDHMMMHRGDKPFACKECKYKASKTSHLKDHIRIHTGEKPFACKQCEYRSSRKQHLKSHLNHRHGVKK